MSIIHTIRAHAQEEINRTKIKGQSGRKVVTHDSKSGLPLLKKTQLDGIACKIVYLHCDCNSHHRYTSAQSVPPLTEKKGARFFQRVTRARAL